MEDYKKKYDELLLKLQKAKVDDNVCDEMYYRVIDDIVPELSESEDEKIRKTLIDFFNRGAENGAQTNGVCDKDIIAWLEKQGEQVSAIRWYDASFIPQEYKELLVEWNSSDATWHDVAFYHANTKTFRSYERELKNVTRWCYVEDLYWEQSNVKETGISQHDKKTCVEWSEEDVAAISCVISVVKWAAYSDHSHPILNDEGATELVERLKSLKDRVLPQPKQKWSEEDEQITLSIEQVMNCASLLNIVPEKIDKIKTWLKSLKDRHTWKPSDEQIKVLDEVIKNPHLSSTEYNTLTEIVEQLEKLKEE